MTSGRASAYAPRTDLSWSVLIDPPLDGPRNMARDHALASTLPPGEAALRIYRWSSPTLSFGRNEPVRALEGRLGALGDISFVRRPTGGRAVLHDRELTYAVIAPLHSLGGVRRAYRLVNEGLVRALRSLGVPAEVGAGEGTASLDSGPCFRKAADGEVVVAGRKLIGSAQVRVGGALLQHGSLPLCEAQSRLDPIWPSGDWAGGAASLAEILGTPPSWEELADAVVTGMREALGGSWDAPIARLVPAARALSAVSWDQSAPGVQNGHIEAELLERYGSRAWTWRR